MNAKSVNAAAGVIVRSMENGRKTPAGWAMDLESAGLLQSPETAAEHQQLRIKYVEAVATVAELVVKRGERMKVENALRDEVEELRARVAGLEAERHTTNEALDDAVQALREKQKQPPRADVIRTVASRLANRASLYGDTRTVNAVIRDLRELAGWVEEIQPVRGAEAEDVSPQVSKLRALLAGQREVLDGEHYAATHHDYRVGHDLPETGGAR